MPLIEANARSCCLEASVAALRIASSISSMEALVPLGSPSFSDSLSSLGPDCIGTGSSICNRFNQFRRFKRFKLFNGQWRRNFLGGRSHNAPYPMTI